MQSVKVWLRRIGLALAGVLMLLLAGTFAYARLKDGWVLSHLPEGSRRVDIGQRKIHMRALGLEHGGPAIVLVPGFLGNSSGWAIVQPELAKTYRVYAFDPAGFAWSDPAPTPLTPSEIADDLHATLTQLGETDVILVGFSGGALAVYNYYNRYPASPRVAGLVWVEGDAMIPEELEWYNGNFPFPLPEALRPAVVELGIWRLLADGLVAQEGQRIPPTVNLPLDRDYWEKALATGGTRQTAYTAFGMVAAFPDDVRATAQMPLPKDVPVFVLQADYEGDLATAKDDQEREALRQLQAKRAAWFHQLAEGSQGGQYRLVSHSNHMLIYEQPQAVVEAIEALATSVK